MSSFHEFWWISPFLVLILIITAYEGEVGCGSTHAILQTKPNQKVKSDEMD